MSHPLITRTVHSLAFLTVIGAVTTAWNAIALAQPAPRPTAPRAAPPAAATPPAGKQPETPKPRDVSLTTKDGVVLAGTYFEGTKGKSAVPVILLHGPSQQRTVMEPLARLIQSLGHAALTIDLRGHGGSVRRVGRDAAVLDEKKMRAADFELFLEDLETAKRFLRDENNAGRCNLDLLGLIAADGASAAAVNWTVQDWSWPALPGRRQGQFVKGLVLLSPERSWGRLNMQAALGTPALSNLSVLVVVGNENRGRLSEANSIKKSLESTMKRAGVDPDTPGPSGIRPLYLLEVPNALTGSDLIDPRNRLGIEVAIQGFIETQLATRAGIGPWMERGM